MSDPIHNTAPDSQTNICLLPVPAKASMRRFLLMPARLWKDTPHWVPPLYIERYLHLSKHNPWFKHADWQAWLAVRDGEAVGRISAHIDHARLERRQDHTGHFGFLDSIDDPEVFRALIERAAAWLKGHGMRRMRGPFNFSTNHDCGMLVEGYDTPPSVMMPHNPPYYPKQMEAIGLSKAQDLLAYRIDADFSVPRGMQSLIDKSADQVRLRPLNRKAMDDDFRLIGEIFNDAWVDNWEFVPFSEAEILDVGHALVHLVKDDYIQIAEVNGEAAGMIVFLPNLNEMIRDLNGSLLPFGWAKLLWRLKRSGARSARIPLMGIKKAWQGSLIGTAMVYRLIAALREPARRDGIKEVELSWILENNQAMRNVIESLGGDPYRRYRIYEKPL